jgi:LysM repeat protein
VSPLRRERIVRYAAPAAFLLAVTIAVLLIRAGLRADNTSPSTTVPTVTTTAPTTTSARRITKRYYTIRSGDTLGVIAERYHTTVGDLLALNPGIDPTTLSPGQKVRVK